METLDPRGFSPASTAQTSPIDIVVAVRAAEGRVRKGRASPTEKLPMRKASGLASVKTELINAIKRVAAFQSISKE